MNGDDPDLDSAYSLETPDDSRVLYAKWARTYDQSFAEAMGFLMPGHVARLFHEYNGEGPVLDAGAGTGLVAAALQADGPVVVDGLDISPQMLDVAGEKGLYRKTIVADLTKPLPIDDAQYNAVTSSGTFTHGHVGPEALNELLRVAASGALFVLTIKTEHYDERGFAAKFESFGTDIADFETVSLPIYDSSAAADHGDDTALVAVFRKA
jgi:predicted TPR repeat methyltransferase